MIDRHPQRGILPGLHRNPPVGVFGHLAEVRSDDHELRPLVARLGDEVHVRRAGHIEIGAHGNYVFGIVPVGALADVGLIAPYFGKGVGQIGVPIIETHVHSTEELQEARAARV